MTMSRTIYVIGKYIILLFLSAAVSLSSVSDGSRMWCSTDAMEPCYFIPNDIPESVDWETAWSACKAHGATLPTIETKQSQDNLESVLKAQLPNISVWTAGRQVRTIRWTWSNGRNLTGRSVYGAINGYETQAVVKTGPQFERAYPRNPYYYICQYSGNCNSNHSIRVGTDCFVVRNDRLNLVNARNKCVDGGGDLATFENENALQSVTRFLSPKEGYWIGLRLSYWVWSKTDSVVDEVKYSNWADFKNVLNEECIFIESNYYKWNQSSCTAQKRVLCQRGKHEKTIIPETTFQPTPISTPTNSEPHSTSNGKSDPQVSHFVAPAIGAAIFIILITIITIVVIRKCGNYSKRTRDPESEKRLAQRQPETTDKEVVSIKPPVETNYGVYAEIPLATKSNTEDEGNTRPGMVYASLDFDNSIRKSNPKPATGTVPQLGDDYAEIAATNYSTGQGQPKAEIPRPHEQLQPTGAIYSNL